ncbi:uncharacterized protein LOC127700787 isoform X1 [Mytilus californianus]|uniref:BTB domain-containing protein n=1 Tax=Mytilus coruscus TaxID=42192 RepID=A0A6J8DFS5_MYTCO|nr:uncharacterized protein LOC127700787 isoform X1 [Mytilus californianus]CAC5406926.1 unnamed protein product [Mytilus coruscus]
MAGILPVTDSRSSSHSKSSSTLETSRDQHNLPFLKEDSYTDTILVIEGRKLYTHRSLLGYASPYFTKLLNSAHSAALSEKKAKAELKIADKNYADFVDMFAFFHPGVCRELNDKMALRLLPLADEFQMAALKDRCERLLVNVLKKTPMVNRASKGPPTHKNRRDNTPEILLKCIKAADQGNSKVLLDQCIRMFSSPEIALKDLKASSEISDTTKSKIFETRMDAASNKLSRMANELDREKHEKEMLKKQLVDRFVPKNRSPRYNGSEPTVEQPRPFPVKLPAHKHHHYIAHQRQIKYAENILGPVHEFSRNEFKDVRLSHRGMIKSDKGDL